MCCFGIFGLVFFVFWLWMLIDCCTKKFPQENDKIIWVLVIALVGPLGALVYFFVGRPKGVKT
ncbi:MAG: PLDc N-terminal domain-containing protein [Phycisphaeraceae bacterium]